ncbi:DUF930 domain-containing protein [Phyllobacterium sp. K27]
MGFGRVIANLSSIFEYAAKPWKRLKFGLPFSLALHLLIGLLLWNGLSFETMPAPKETIDVKLVPPPAPSSEPVEKSQLKPPSAPAQPPAGGSPAFAAATAKTEPKTAEKELPPIAAQESSEPDNADDETKPEKPAKAEKSQEQEKSPEGLKPASEEKPRPEAKEAITAEPAKPKANEKVNNPTPVKELFSQEALASFRVRQSARKMSARDRIMQLCTIEALEQVRRQRPGSFPDLLVPGGRISEYSFNTSDGAFRSRGDWYNINFKCTVDNNRSKVVSFSFAVGDSVPRSDWSSRSLLID